ncbi:hypothetical protein BH24PSE2_BH24PSE2_16430 [soil metagenome]
MLILYSRRGCHLCEILLEELETTCRGHEFEVVDVDSAPALAARYGVRVPVLVADGAELCTGQLDYVALAAYLRRC